jgi:hypothetical protein
MREKNAPVAYYNTYTQVEASVNKPKKTHSQRLGGAIRAFYTKNRTRRRSWTRGLPASLLCVVAIFVAPLTSSDAAMPRNPIPTARSTRLSSTNCFSRRAFKGGATDVINRLQVKKGAWL